MVIKMESMDFSFISYFYISWNILCCHLKLLKNQDTEDRPDENSRFFAVWKAECISTQAGLLKHEDCSMEQWRSVLCDLNCCAERHNSGSSSEWPSYASFPGCMTPLALKDWSRCLAEATVLPPVHTVPSSKTGLGTNLWREFMLIRHTLGDL